MGSKLLLSAPPLTLGLVTPAYELDRGKSAEKKNGVGWEDVYECDEGAPVSVCTRWRRRGVSMSKWYARVRGPRKVLMSEVCARQTVCESVWGRVR